MGLRSACGGRLLAIVARVACAGAVVGACGPSVGPVGSGATGTSSGGGTTVATLEADASTSTGAIADGTSTGREPTVYQVFWQQGVGDDSREFRFFRPCDSEDGYWDVSGAIPEIEDCTSLMPNYLRVTGELVPPRIEGGRPTLVVEQVLEGPCWQHTCDGGDPCDCVTFDEHCGSSQWPCDVFKQNCPEGEKCMPWSSTGDLAWNSTRCSPIADDAGQPGEPCTIEGNRYSGIDDCAAGAICWHVEPGSDVGVCEALCDANACNAEPGCEEAGTACAFDDGGSIMVCLPECDPLAADCVSGYDCVETIGGWFCLP